MKSLPPATFSLLSQTLKYQNSWVWCEANKTEASGLYYFPMCLDKGPQTWKLKPTQICSLPILEATSLRSESLGSHHSVCRTTLPLEDRRTSLPAPVSGGFQHSLTCGHFPPFSAPMVTLPYLVSNFPLPPSSFENNNFYCFIKKIFFLFSFGCARS